MEKKNLCVAFSTQKGGAGKTKVSCLTPPRLAAATSSNSTLCQVEGWISVSVYFSLCFS